MMMVPARRWIDLHLHSMASDGRYAPCKVMEMAAARGLSAVSLTDHDATAGLAEAEDAATQLGMEFVPGIEMEAEYGRHRLHILGYFIDATNAGLVDALAKMVVNRHARNEEIIARLRCMGVVIDYRAICKRHAGAAIGRPHIADELIRQRAVSSFQQAFSRYLGNEAPAYVPRVAPTGAEVIRIIREAGGVASLAHPGRIKTSSHLELATMVRDLRDGGLSAIEISHPDHNDATAKLAAELAARFELLTTGGSDFHTLGTAVTRGTGFAKRRVPYEWLERLRGERPVNPLRPT
ncbi:MAG: PHP domain-containing protein [Planctomycetes bacterium]|nr:PHP domain-containing protein [Planctomycetota bacterium]